MQRVRFRVTVEQGADDWVLKWGADDPDVAKTGAGAFLSNARCKQHNEPGNQIPLDRAVLKRLYPGPSDYQSKVKAAAGRALAAHWITRQDAAAIVSETEKAATELN